MIHNKYFEIMKLFLRGYSKEIYGRELIKKVSISQKNIALTLDKLEKESILFSKMKGTSKYFFLNRENSLIQYYLVLAEVEQTIEFLKKYQKINQIIKKLNCENKIVCIFGSYARNLAKKDSDLDLFIVGNFDEREIKKIGENFGVKVSIKGGSKKDFVDSLKNKNSLMNEILEDHVIISGYEEFVKEVIKQKW